MREFRVSLLLFVWILLVNASPRASAAGKPQVSIAEAVAEALDNNPGLIAERAGITVAQTAMVTARLRKSGFRGWLLGHVVPLLW